MSSVLSVEKRSNEHHSFSLFFLRLGVEAMTKKKHLGIKAQIRAEKSRERRIAAAILLIVIFFCVVLSAYFGYTILNSSLGLNLIEPTLQFKPENSNPELKTLQFKPENSNPELKAAIVDQLSLTFPNQAFIQAAVDILERANYSIDYYAGENVTVEFYRNLPTHGYKILILRVHSLTDIFQGKSWVDFFTSELYSTTRYVYEQLTQQIASLGYYPGAQTRYFGISQDFVKTSMNGGFNNTLVVAMGCNGLNNADMAEAFIEKGARVYVSWNGSVSPSHTDQAITQLLQHLVTEKQTIRQAVYDAMIDVGLDPEYESMLGYYPRRVGDQTIELSGRN
jgi:hypothetical protein